MKRPKLLAEIVVRTPIGTVRAAQEDRGKSLSPEQQAALDDALQAVQRFVKGSQR